VQAFKFNEKCYAEPGSKTSFADSLLEDTARFVRASVFFGTCLLFLTGWVRPQFPAPNKAVEESESKLDYIVIEVEKETRIVASHQTLNLVRGDRFRVKRAQLHPEHGEATHVNVVGFRNPKGLANDQGYEIRSDRDLLGGWSEQKHGTVYAITVGKPLAGGVFINLVDPVLHYCILLVNGQSKVFRAGEIVAVKATDEFKVDKIVTNMPTHDDLNYKVLDQSIGDNKQYEIRFLRHERPFASINLKVQ
jgi:hypothetical protein